MRARVAIARLHNVAQDSWIEAPGVPTELTDGIGGVLDDLGAGARLRGRSVFIKPNLNFVPGALHPFAMVDPRVLLALVSCLRDAGAASVTVGEKPGQQRRSDQVYALLRQHLDVPTDLRLLEIDTAPRRSSATKTRLLTESLELPAAYLDAEVVISLAKLKTHTLTTVSLGIKNLFGLLSDAEKMRHHNADVEKKLVDLLSVRQPDLTLLDALVGLEGQGPMFGQARPVGLLLAGTDAVATDAAGAHVMGIPADDVAHIALAAHNRLGEDRLSHIEFPGLPAEACVPAFLQGDLWANPLPQIQVIRGDDVPAGYANALSHSLERLAFQGQVPEATKIFVGSFPAGHAPAGAILLGDVTLASLDGEELCRIPGHPPPAFALYTELLARCRH